MDHFLENSKFAKEIFLSTRYDPDPVQLFRVPPGQNVSGPTGSGFTTLLSKKYYRMGILLEEQLLLYRATTVITMGSSVGSLNFIFLMST